MTARRAAPVVVVGAGMAGLTIAHDLARAGVAVVVVEASDRLGGLLQRGTLAGVDLDLGAESYATRTDAVPRLVADAELDLELVTPREIGAHLAVPGPEGRMVIAPLPRRTVLGIPADPAAADVVAIIGPEAAARAAAERDLPPMGGGADYPSLHDLVAERLGPVVADRLVDTICRSVYSRPARELRLSAVHPRMWDAYRRHGRLLDAAAEVASDARAGAAVGGIAGGMWRLPDALAARARALGAEIRPRITVDRIEERADGLVVHTPAGALDAARIVVATGPRAADRLLAVPLGEPVDEHDRGDHDGRVRVVAAAIDNADLDAHPVGSGVIAGIPSAGVPSAGSDRPGAAKALTHVDAKWPWMDASLPAGRHIVRLSARSAVAPGLDTAEAVAGEISRLTGVSVAPGDVIDLVVQDWVDAVATDDRDGGADRRARVARLHDRGIHHAGAAAAGTGLASVIPHARALAARLVAELSTPSSARPTRSPA